MKIYLVTLLSFFSVNLLAQLETDTQYPKWIIGSEFNAFISNEEGAVISDDLKLKTTSFTIAPFLGRKLNDNWLIGLQIGYKKIEEVQDYIIGIDLDPSTGFTVPSVSAVEVNQKEVFFGSFARRYFKLTDKFQAFLQTSLVYSIKNQDDAFVEKTKDWNFSLGVSPGISWTLSKRINIISKFSSIGYRFGKQKRAAYDSGIIINNTPVVIEGGLGTYSGGVISSPPFTRITQPALEMSYSEFDTNFGISSFLVGVEFKW